MPLAQQCGGSATPPAGHMQAQRPVGLDAVEIDQRALVQHREVAALADLADHAPQTCAARGGAIVAQHVEREARQALADDVGAPAGLAGEEARLLEQRERAVQRRLRQFGRLHQFRQRDRAPGAHQHLEHAEGLERRGGFAGDLAGLGGERQDLLFILTTSFR